LGGERHWGDTRIRNPEIKKNSTKKRERVGTLTLGPLSPPPPPQEIFLVLISV